MSKRFIRPALLAILWCLALPAHALVINSSEGRFDVTTLTGSATDLLDILDDQVWWDDVDLAEEFALLVRGDLPGTFDDDGPIFAFSGPSQTEGVICLDPGAADCDILVTSGLFLSNPDFVFAVARAVPEPSTLALLGAGLLGLGFARRRTRR